MSAEIAIIAGSSIAGAISAAFIDRFSKSRGGDKRQFRSTGSAKAELSSLLFEKNLTAEAITRVYEASQGNKIDRLQRDRLLLKYKQQLDSLNQRIGHLKPVVDYADLSEMRNSLVVLLENKISALDQKLLELKTSAPDNTIDARVQKIISETTANVQSSPVEHKPFESEEKSIDQLQKEIVHALEQLEQVEIDKD
jgi:hypothetical protein